MLSFTNPRKRIKRFKAFIKHARRARYLAGCPIPYTVPVSNPLVRQVINSGNRSAANDNASKEIKPPAAFLEIKPPGDKCGQNDEQPPKKKMRANEEKQDDDEQDLKGLNAAQLSCIQTKLEKRLESVQEARGQLNYCVVCSDGAKDHVIIPCGHVCVCSQCQKNYQQKDSNCPVCRAPVQSVVKIYS